MYSTGQTNSVLSDALLHSLPLPGILESVEFVPKGWSSEKKYRLALSSGGHMLLRVRTGDRHAAHKQEYRFIRSLNERGLAVPMAHGFGLLPEGSGSWMLLDWVDGTDAEETLPRLHEMDQYRLGCEAGRLLREIHATRPQEGNPSPGQASVKAMDKLARIAQSGIRVDHMERIVAFIREHLGDLDTLPLVCQHGDFHPGNMILTPLGRLFAIDFNRWGLGDAAEEFSRVQSFTVEISVPFARGQVGGYFEGRIPPGFWEALAAQVAVVSIYSVLWAIPFGKDEVRSMEERCDRAYRDFAGFSHVVPAWYGLA